MNYYYFNSKYETLFKEKEKEILKMNSSIEEKDSDRDKEKERESKREKIKSGKEKTSEKKQIPSKYEDIYNIHWKDKKLSEMTERDWRIFREDHDIIIKGGRVPYPIRSWEESNLPDYILEAIKYAGYKKPSSIQIQAITIGLERKDMIGLAPTGSGKSAAFLIPLIVYLNSLPAITPETAQNGPYAMILAPSRELALQIYDEFNKFAKYTKLRAASIVGGKSAEEQALILGVGVEVIIGTPGRIQDTLEKHFTCLTQCNYIVLDEADKMIKDGFEENLNYILDCIPATNMKSEDEKLVEEQEKECKLGIKSYRITMMFSATMTHQLEKLARKYLRCPSYISIGEPGAGKKEIEQRVEIVTENQKKERLMQLLDKFKPPIMIFLNHKRSVDNLCKLLEKIDVNAATLHGGKTQESRERSLNGFKEGKYDVLVCTNLAARGIDVYGVTLVVNYDAPTSIEGNSYSFIRSLFFFYNLICKIKNYLHI